MVRVELSAELHRSLWQGVSRRNQKWIKITCDRGLARMMTRTRRMRRTRLRSALLQTISWQEFHESHSHSSEDLLLAGLPLDACITCMHHMQRSIEHDWQDHIFTSPELTSSYFHLPQNLLALLAHAVPLALPSDVPLKSSKAILVCPGEKIKTG